MSDDPNAGADDIDKLLGQIAKEGENSAVANARMLDNHLMHSDRVIANVAALRAINSDTDGLLKELLKDP